MEEALGELFYRRERGMTLTPAGKVLLEYADRAVRLLKEAEIAVRDMGQVKGGLSIGSTDSTAAVRLPLVLAHYHQKYPDVEIMLSTATSEKLIIEVLADKIEGAFVCGEVSHADIEQKLIINEELVIITGNEVELLEGLQKPNLLVYPSGCSYRAMLEKWLCQTGISQFKVMELGTMDGILGCVAAGMGISLGPRSLITSSNYEGKVKMHKIAEPFGELSTFFIYRRSAMLTRAAKALIQVAVDLYS